MQLIPQNYLTLESISQNGWPSVTSPGVQPNSPSAVADVQNEHVSFFTFHKEDLAYAVQL